MQITLTESISNQPSRLKQIFSWLTRIGLISATFWFLGQTLMANWQEVKTLELQPQAWLYCSLAFIIIFAGQIWVGYIWGWILDNLQYAAPKRWSVITFLRNTPAKYIPGNFWHLYGRVLAAQSKGISLESVTLSVMLEPLLTIGASLSLALLHPAYPKLKIIFLALILLALHPWFLNQLWRGYRRLKGEDASQVGMQHYPLRELVGTIAFMVLRGIGFICVVLAFTETSWTLVPLLMGGFSLAWILSLVTPAPGGIGVFEASALAMLGGSFSPALLLAIVAVYRLLNTGAELLGACVAYSISDSPDQPEYLSVQISDISA